MSAAAIAAGFRRGAGKLDFLSMASMRRWNLRKRASARIRVDSRSILPESSLTAAMATSVLCYKEGRGVRDVLYFSTSSKCCKCVMITSRCFSRIASATNKWKLLVRKSVHRPSHNLRISIQGNSRLYQTNNMRKKKKKLVLSAFCR